MIVTESGEVLYQVREGRYRIVYAERDNQRNGAPKILDVESVLDTIGLLFKWTRTVGFYSNFKSLFIFVHPFQGTDKTDSFK